ncbi:MAG: thioredoxin [Lentimicrobium sp.]|nr:thioredoxin [Lentimicrobium sp.]
MNNRIFSIVLIASIGLLGCGSSNGKSNQDKDNQTASTASTPEEGKVVQMNKAMFIEKVFNYEENPNEWKFRGDKPCIIDFYADWCGPCKKVAPVMAELAEQYKDQIVIYKVDTDKERELAQIFNIRSIPSILFCPASGQPQMTMGALPKAEFEKMIKELLLAPAAEPTSQK